MGVLKRRDIAYLDFIYTGRACGFSLCAPERCAPAASSRSLSERYARRIMLCRYYAFTGQMSGLRVTAGECGISKFT